MMKLSAPVYQLKRRAKLMARDENIPLHMALDRVAAAEGVGGWSLLSSRIAASTRTEALLPKLTDGDMLLLGARPGHGKTQLGIDLLLDAVCAGRRAVFFTLEYTDKEARELLHRQAGKESEFGDAVEIVTSDEISADYIMRHLAAAREGTVAVVDYLQILDQRRTNPDLASQVASLRNFAKRTGVILAFISQIDRSFDADMKSLPDVSDIRLPNKVDMSLFSKTCFLHDGRMLLR